MEYQYQSGMYGGKFIPLHKGHKLCIDVALSLCKEVHLILFTNGSSEVEIMSNEHNLPREFLEIPFRVKQLESLANNNPRLKVHVIDVSSCRLPNGEEDWDAETPLVLNECGKFDAVFSSEPSYDPYFKRAYPWAKHILVDVDRDIIPISATMVRDMNKKAAHKWMIETEKKTKITRERALTIASRLYGFLIDRGYDEEEILDACDIQEYEAKYLDKEDTKYSADMRNEWKVEDRIYQEEWLRLHGNATENE